MELEQDMAMFDVVIADISLPENERHHKLARLVSYANTCANFIGHVHNEMQAHFRFIQKPEVVITSHHMDELTAYQHSFDQTKSRLDAEYARNSDTRKTREKRDRSRKAVTDLSTVVDTGVTHAKRSVGEPDERNYKLLLGAISSLSRIRLPDVYDGETLQKEKALALAYWKTLHGESTALISSTPGMIPLFEIATKRMTSETFAPYNQALADALYMNSVTLYKGDLEENQIIVDTAELRADGGVKYHNVNMFFKLTKGAFPEIKYDPRAGSLE